MRASEIIATLPSRHLGNERSIWVREPASAATAGNLVLFFDAEMYREKVGAAGIIEDLVAQDAIADAWFVFVSSHSPEARWRECPCYPPFADFVRDELLPWLERRFPPVAAARRRTAVGLSYTGLAASYLAFACPGLFQQVISQSGSYWWNEGWLIERFRELSQPIPAAFRLEVGRRETQTNLQHREDVFQRTAQIDAVREFRDVLAGTGHAVEYAESDGAHDAWAWAKALPGALRWALPRG